PPEGLFQATPTICVECVQATICAENAAGDGCPANQSPTPIDSLSTLIPAGQEQTATSVVTEAPVLTETPALTEGVIISTPSVTNEAANTVTANSSQLSPFTETVNPLKTSISKTPSLKTPTTTSTPRPGPWVYKLQSGTPKYTKNFAHPDKACNWSGVAGQVFGPGGVPQPDVVVIVNGEANGEPFDLLGFTGSFVQYGEGAFEVEFPNGPVKTIGTLRIQLFDLEGKELTVAIPFNTYTECTKNLVIFNFTLTK
ncbi:MAG TPA: hypothetical protein VF338_06415, partial [Leptolinea sp.]